MLFNEEYKNEDEFEILVTPTRLHRSSQATDDSEYQPEISASAASQFVWGTSQSSNTKKNSQPLTMDTLQMMMSPVDELEDESPNWRHREEKKRK